MEETPAFASNWCFSILHNPCDHKNLHKEFLKSGMCNPWFKAQVMSLLTELKETMILRHFYKHGAPTELPHRRQSLKLPV
jgi:hypothetical protein